MDFILALFEYRIFGNNVGQWALVLGVLALALALLLLIREGLVQRLRRSATATDHLYDDFLADLAERLRLSLLFFVLLWLAGLNLALPDRVMSVLRLLALGATLIQVGLWAGHSASYGARFLVARRVSPGSEANETAISALGLMGRILIWALVFVLILDNIPGIEVNTLVTGLGITGIAVALAVQNVLGDLIGYVSIVLDRPFEIGDLIRVDNITGHVRQIGLKTTRVESITGEQVIFANSDLLGSRVQNLGRSDARRVVFTLGVTYETRPEQLRAIPDLIREAVEGQGLATFERAHFRVYGDFALIYEVSMRVNSPVFMDLFDAQHQINLAIFERFTAEGIEFAYPTQTVHVKQGQVR